LLDIVLNHIKLIVKDSAIYSLGNAFGKLVGLILLPFYLKELTTEQYGILVTLEATSILVITLAGMELSSAFVRWYYDKDWNGRQSSAFFTLFVIIGCIAIFLNLCAYPFTADISKLFFKTEQYSNLIRLMLFCSGLELIGSVPATLCRAQSNSILFTRNTIIRLIAILISTLIFLLVYDRKLEGIYMGQLIGIAVYVALFIPYIYKNIRIRFDLQIFKQMFLFSIPLFLSSAFGVLLIVIDRLSLNFIAGATIAGIYALGLKLANLLKMVIVQPIRMAIHPIIFKISESTDPKQFYAKITKYACFVMMFAVIAISIFGQEAIKVLSFGKTEYWKAYIVIPPIALSILFGLMKDLSIYYLQIVHRTTVIASVVIFVSSLNIGFNILFINLFGAIGAAISILLSQIIFCAMMLYFVRIFYPINFEYRKILLSIALGVIFCSVVYFISNFNIIIRLCIKSIILLSYLPLLYLFNLFDKAELQALYGFWKKWKNLKNLKKNIASF
jgi:O-antigen/teichoic acid export membrane protein